MRRVYWLWAAGLLLKGIGATWDVAWHFRFLREALSPPHMVNIAGGVLCAIALFLEWRRGDPRQRGALRTIFAGTGLFLLAMPFDEWWHRTFGIDLTTWSPAHMMLFTGTMVAVFGVLHLYVNDLRGERELHDSVRRAPLRARLMLAFFVVFLAGAVYFPLTYNEYAAGAVVLAERAPERLDPDILALLPTLDDPVFHNTPRWLYPVYSVVAAAFVGTLARAWLGRGWGLVALGGVAAERALADALLQGLGWPNAAVPLQFLAAGLALELLWLPRAPAFARALAGAIAATTAAYLWMLRPLTWAPVVPVEAEAWPAAVAVATALALVALGLVRYGLGDEPSGLQHAPARVRAWMDAQRARR